MPEALLGAGAVALGAAIGGPARFFISGMVARQVGETFPWGTLAVNVSGCFLMGVLGAVARAAHFSGQSPFWLLCATGALGSYTTVSSFSLQTRALARAGEPRRAIGNVALSLLLCLIAVAIGFACANVFAGHAGR